jgi:catechol 2,3-dioxygenase-like lactoylglutathione lyase family enzyme
MAIVPVRKLFEAHLTVSDLDRSIVFYRDVVGLELAHRVPERHAAFFWIGPPGHSMLGLWSIHSAPMRMRLHIAFDTALHDVVAAVNRLRQAGITPTDGDGGAIKEPVVLAWMPAASVYFDDPDGHALEYIAMLPDPPRPELGRMTLSRWRAMVAGASG